MVSSEGDPLREALEESIKEGHRQQIENISTDLLRMMFERITAIHGSVAQAKHQQLVVTLILDQEAAFMLTAGLRAGLERIGEELSKRERPGT